MPVTFGEPFAYPLITTTRSSVDQPLLPIHVAQHRETVEQQRRRSIAEQGTELQDIESAGNTGYRRTSGHEDEQQDDADKLDEAETESLLSDSDSQSPHPQMQRRHRKTKAKNLHIDTSGQHNQQNGHITPNGHVTSNGHITPNGHLDEHQQPQANGSMTSHVELRRKHGQVPLDGSEAMKEHVMSREDFSLDQEPPAPTTPATPALSNTSFMSLPVKDRKNFLLLVLLYFLQGIPMGLAAGSVPFLLKKRLSYTQIGIFSLAMYPYSLKLLWSPIVDAVWSRRLGRRKSWILPMQAISGLSMVYLGSHVDVMMAGAEESESAVWSFTAWWFLLVFLCATQDIAVDGWAISLLSVQNIAYASTAQSVGLTAGSFLSYTVFLALQAPEFANKWLRGPNDQDLENGLITLGGYITLFGWVYLVVTACLTVLKREEKTREKDGIIDVYRSMWSILKLKPILTIIVIHLIAKLGFITNESVTNLKLLDKGFGQANMALVVLIDFPFELGLGYYAGKWSTEYGPLRLWCWAFIARLGAAVWAQITIYIYPLGYPRDTVPLWYMLVVIAEHIYTTFMGTVMFVAVAAFHARIADPTIGGTYMTLLAT